MLHGEHHAHLAAALSPNAFGDFTAPCSLRCQEWRPTRSAAFRSTYSLSSAMHLCAQYHVRSTVVQSRSLALAHLALLPDPRSEGATEDPRSGTGLTLLRCEDAERARVVGLFPRPGPSQRSHAFKTLLVGRRRPGARNEERDASVGPAQPRRMEAARPSDRRCLWSPQTLT